MDRGIRQSVGAHELEPVSLSELIHQHVRATIETAVHEELRAVLGATPDERSEVGRGYRNGTKARTLTGPKGQSRSPCREPRCSPAGRNGRRRSSPAIINLKTAKTLGLTLPPSLLLRADEVIQ